MSATHVERGRTGRGKTTGATGSPTGPTGKGSTGILNTIPANVVPAPGTAGDPVELTTNFIEWTARQETAQTYHVTFTPDVEAVPTRRRLIRLLREQNRLPNAFIYDGDANLKTIDVIPHLSSPVMYNETQYTIAFTGTGEIAMGSPEMMRLYNTQSRQNLRHLGFVQIGRDYYDPKTERKLAVQNVMLWFGMDTTVLSCVDNRQLMVLNSISKVIRTETPLDLMRKIRQEHKQDFQTYVRNALVGRTVITKYNNRHYRVADVDFDSNPNSTFSFTNRATGLTQDITFAQYLQDQYQQTVTIMTQPLLVTSLSARDKRAGKTEAAKLVPELCALTGIADLIADTFLRREMIAATKKKPGERVRDIRAFMAKCVANLEIRREMDAWGLGFGGSLVTLPGRQLKPERVTMDGGQSFNAVNGDFDRELKNNRLKETTLVKSWTVIFFRQDAETVRSFLTTLNEQSKRLGLLLDRPNMIPLDDNRIHSYIGAINQLPGDCQLVMPFISRTTETEKYSAIKKQLCCERPLPSQVIVAYNVRDPKKTSSIALKVAIQVNCKLGGVPWELEMPPVNLMVVGYDTHHDTMMRRSVGAFVSSSNPEMTKWFSRVRYHDDLQELSTHFARNMKEAMENYKRHNNDRYPEKVVVYRDGVGEGQLAHVHNIEKQQIKEVLEELSPVNTIALSIVVVTKRVAARLFLKQGSDFANPGPGTIADSVITRANSYDFFLISQNVRDGTVSPVNYNIIEDTTGWTRTHHQRMAYKLCHLYFNWPGTVKVPCPCQYAHKLSFLVGSYIHQEPHPVMSNRLWFL